MYRKYWLLPILAVFVLWLGKTAVSVQAHAQLLEANPAPGSTLDAPPTEIRLTFNEPIGTDSRLSLFDNNFYAQPGVESFVDPQNPDQLVATVPPLAAGIYNVNWTAVSADGHLVSGSFRFQIGPTNTTPNESTSSAGWLLPALLVGLALFGAIFWISRKRATNKLRDA